MPFSHTSSFARLTDEQHKLIGMFVCEWATAEFFLGVLLSRLLLAPEFLSRTYTDSLSGSKVQAAISQAIEIHKYRYGCKLISIDALDEIAVLNRKIEGLRSLRNKFAHFCWSRASDDEIFGTSLSGAVPSDKRHKRSFVSLEMSEIRKQYDELFSVVERLQTITYGLPEVPEESATGAFKQHTTGSN